MYLKGKGFVVSYSEDCFEELILDEVLEKELEEIFEELAYE